MATLRRCINAMNDGIVALAVEWDAPLFDLRAALGDQPDLFWDFVHCNAAGCDRQAQAIAEQAAALGLWDLGRLRDSNAHQPHEQPADRELQAATRRRSRCTRPPLCALGAIPRSR